MIKTVKDILNSLKCAIYFDYNKIGRVLQLSNVRKCILDNFNETVPENKILESQAVIDDMISKIHKNELDNMVDKIYDLPEIIKYMIGCKTIAEKNIRYHYSILSKIHKYYLIKWL